MRPVSPAAASAPSFLAIAALACLLSAGCAAPPRQNGPFGEERAIPRPIRTGDLFVPPRGTLRFHAAEGDHQGETVIWRRSEPDEDGRWTLTRMVEGAEQPRRVETRTRRDDGAVVLIAAENFDRNVYTTYDPPLVIMPAALGADETFRQEIKLLVHPLDDRDRVRNRGDGVQEISLKARQRVHAPGRTFDSVRVYAKFTTDVSAAKVVSETETWLSLEDDELQGPIAERYREVVKVLGLPTGRRDHLLLRQMD